MQTKPVALQLYSVREYAVQDYAGTVRKIAGMGFAGVEPAGFPGYSPQSAGMLFRELGLQVPSAHTPMPVGDQAAEVLDGMEAIGCQRMISGFGPDAFKTMDLVRQSCDTFNQAMENARQRGISFGIHNHWWEYQQVEGEWVYRKMLELLDPEIFFELDTYWIQTAGLDPAAIVREFGARAPFLHIKDGPAQTGRPMTALGEGVVDIPAIVLAGQDTVEWLVVELDACASDMLEAVEKSYRYLVNQGLGHGR